MPLRVRADDPHRRGPHRAAGHRAGDASRHRHRAPEVRLPNLRATGHPGGRAGAPHHSRAADRGGAGPSAHFQVRGPFAAVSAIADLRPIGGGTGPFHARRLGGQGVVSPHSGGGSARLASEAVRSSVHGRDSGAGAGPGPGQDQDQDGVSVGAGPRSAALGRPGSAWRGVLHTRPGAADATPRDFSRA